jgi:hypothetical protein
MTTNETRVTRANWADFDHVDCPKWMTEDQANQFASALNAYIPEEYGRRGCRYHVLNHFNGGLFFHLLNRPREI